MVWAKATSVTASGSPISSGTFTTGKTLQVMCYLDSNGTIQDGLRLGNGSVDTGSKYAYSYKANNGSMATSHTQDDIGDFSNIGNGQFINMFVANVASNEKLLIMTINEGKSGTTVPTRLSVTGKLVSTSQINIIEWRDVAGAGDYGSDTNISVLTSEGTESMSVQEGAVYYDTDLNKEYVLYNNTWTEV